MSTLLLRLAAPLQSWGVDGKYDRRGTERAPTKSGVVGLVAAALGRRRNERIDDLASLRFGVRIDREGVLLHDYHTAKSAKSAYVTHRYYLADAVFLVGLEGDRALLEKIAYALGHPAFPLFLGRRSCPPSGQVSLGMRELPLIAALMEEPLLVEARTAKGGAEIKLRILIDAEPTATTRFTSDKPLSFDQRSREYGFRSVQDDVVTKETTHTEPSTQHDPMRELEG